MFDFDFHVHTSLSDEAHPPAAVLALCRRAGVRAVALTDHNYLYSPDHLRQLREESHHTIELIPGSEISCTHTIGEKEVELHIVTLFHDDSAPELEAVCRQNLNQDRRGYISTILDRLSQFGIYLPPYDELAEKYRDSGMLGRMVLAREMAERGYVSTPAEALDVYIGNHGKAYCKNTLRYASLEQVVSAALASRATPVLAHLFYYVSLTEGEREQLLGDFRDMTGPIGAMEVEYDPQRDKLAEYARRFDLTPSAGSDFHSVEAGQHLGNRFPDAIYHDLVQQNREFYGK